MNTRDPDVQKAVDVIDRLHSRLLRTGKGPISSIYQKVLLELIASSVKVFHDAGIELNFTESGVTWSRREMAEVTP